MIQNQQSDGSIGKGKDSSDTYHLQLPGAARTGGIG